MLAACARWSITAIVWICASATLHAQPAVLSNADRLLLAENRALGRAKLPLLLATAPSSSGTVATALEKRGSEVIGRRDAIGWPWSRLARLLVWLFYLLKPITC